MIYQDIQDTEEYWELEAERDLEAVEADADALAGIGWGVDEDYGLIGGDSDLLGEW